MRTVLVLLAVAAAVAYANPVEPQSIGDVKDCLLNKVGNLKSKGMAFHQSVVDRVQKFAEEAHDSDTADKVKAAVDRLQSNIFAVVETIIRFDFWSVRDKTKSAFEMFGSDMNEVIQHADATLKPKVMALVQQFQNEAVDMGKLFLTECTFCIIKMFE